MINFLVANILISLIFTPLIGALIGYGRNASKVNDGFDPRPNAERGLRKRSASLSVAPREKVFAHKLFSSVSAPTNSPVVGANDAEYDVRKAS